MLDEFIAAWNKWRIWDKKKYKDQEINEILTLQELYKSIFNEPIENTLLDFDIEKCQPNAEVTKKTIESYKKLCSKRFAYDSYITANANSLLLNIAQFIYEQTPKEWLKEIFNSRYPNDPVNLFCLQIANWAKDSLSTAKCNNETIEMIQRWMKYLHRARREVFNKPEHLELRKLITSTIHLLENIEEQVQLKIKSHSIKDNLDSLVNYGKNIIALSFEFLFYIFNNQEAPFNFSLINIHNDDKKQFDFLNNSMTGQYLLLIAHSQPVCELFDLKCTNSSEDKGLVRSQSSPAVEVDRFINKEDGKVVEKTLQTLDKAIEERHPDEKKKFPEIWSLVHDLEIGRKNALKHFIALHGLFLLFAINLLNCREACEIANAGGDILLCFSVKENLQFTMACYQRLNAVIAFHVKNLMCIARKSEEQIDSEQQNGRYIKWLNNLIIAENIYNEIMVLFNNTTEHTIKILESVSNIKNTINETRRRLNNFVNTSKQLAQQQPWLAVNNSLNLSSVRELEFTQEAVINIRPLTTAMAAPSVVSMSPPAQTLSSGSLAIVPPIPLTGMNAGVVSTASLIPSDSPAFGAKDEQKEKKIQQQTALTPL